MVANAPLIICVVLLIFIIGIFFILIWMNSQHPNDKKIEDPFKQYLKIENDSYSGQNVAVEDLNFVLSPGESKNITVSSNSKIKAGSFHLHLEDVAAVNTIYITENGIFTNLKCAQGTLNNDSNVPITFVEVGKDGKKWNRGVVYPEKSINAVISYNSKWEVASPEKPNNILTSIKVKGGTKIIYDGKHLINK
jgi:hypothetical protein